jgi:hypothetical protein
LAALCGSAEAGAARDYLNAPVDSWLSFANSNYLTSVTPEDGYDISSAIRTDVFSQSFVLTRTFDVWGRTGGLSAIVPYVAASASNDAFNIASDGMSDLGLLAQVNLFGGPAISRADFGSFVPETFSSIHFIALAPTGKYDSQDAINPSSNRWTFFPTINFSYTPDAGWTWLELYGSAKIFTDNNAFGPGGAARLEQDPLYLLEFHGSRNVTPRLWLSADAYYNFGGETLVDGLRQDNAANTLRLGAGAGLAVWPGGQLITTYEQTVAKPEGDANSIAVLLKIQQLW